MSMHEDPLDRNEKTSMARNHTFLGMELEHGLTNNLLTETRRRSCFCSLNSVSTYNCSPFHFPFMFSLFQVGKNNESDTS